MVKVGAKKASDAFFPIKKQVGPREQTVRRKRRGRNEISSAYPFKSKSQEPLSFANTGDRLHSFSVKKKDECHFIF